MANDLSDCPGKYRGVAVAAGFALLGLVAWLDYKTGVEISFSIFYLIPISLVAWTAGLAPGLAISVVAAAVWLLMDHVLGGRGYTNPLIAYWNSLVRFGFFALTCVSISYIHKMTRRTHESSRLKSDMVSMVSHELNNALVSINLVSTLLQEDDGETMPEPRLKLYGILDSTSRSLKQMVSNFLNKARLDSGRFTLELRPTELRKIIMEVVDTVRPLSDAKSVFVDTEFPPEVIPVKVDPDAIALVLNNLIGNAIKYTPQNGRVKISIAREEGSAGQVLISVRDTGIGIDSKEIDSIFSGFYRAPAGKTTAKGFGIGLKVAKDLLAAHHSRLAVNSAPGLGSVFSFTLPVWDSKSEAKEKA